MLRTSPFAEDGWAGAWTIFYWGWWMSWAPFVGMFIARISRGRTIREFVFGVLLAPTVIGSLWFTIFGDSGILRQRNDGDMLTADGAVDTNTTLFHLLDGLPLSTVTSVLAIAVVVFFFVTSSDFRLSGHRHPFHWRRFGDTEDHTGILVGTRGSGRSGTTPRRWKWLVDGATDRVDSDRGALLDRLGARMRVHAQGIPLRRGHHSAVLTRLLARFGRYHPTGITAY